VSKDKGPWGHGRRAWERLTDWQQEHSARSHEARAGALGALADIGVLRRLLDQAELSAVRAARGGGRSWAEIATMLGVSRQSAWERWRELDDDGAGASRSDADPAKARQETWAAEALSSAATKATADSTRRRSSVVVPNVTGRIWEDAFEALRDKGLVAVAVGPGGLDVRTPEWAGSVVTDQVPESGAKVPEGTVVRLWNERGDGGAGVREPRRPKPDPKSARAMNEPSVSTSAGDDPRSY
jgi:hypothetical protein